MKITNLPKMRFGSDGSKGLRLRFYRVLVGMLYSLIFGAMILVSCGGGKKKPNTDAMLGLLPQETGSDGICTVSGLNSQVRSGFLSATTTASPVVFREIATTSYAVVLVKDANMGTILEITENITTDIYKSGTCPLYVNQDNLAEVTKDYLAEPGAVTKITFIRRGSYMLYFQMRNRDISKTITAKLSGTPTAPVTSGTATTVGDLAFVKSCRQDANKICTNLYGTETACESGEVENAEKCATTDVLGICRKPVSTTGYRFYTFYNGGMLDSITAPLACSTKGGSYSSGYTAP